VLIFHDFITFQRDSLMYYTLARAIKVKYHVDSCLRIGIFRAHELDIGASVRAYLIVCMPTYFTKPRMHVNNLF
jgi:hypothetical protein